MPDSPLANVLNQECVHFRVWEEEGTWIAECIDIPGCMSQGETRAEALANIMDAANACLEVIAEDAGVSIRGSDSVSEIIDMPMSTLYAVR